MTCVGILGELGERGIYLACSSLRFFRHVADVFLSFWRTSHPSSLPILILLYLLSLFLLRFR